ncbi:hypothetical protein ScPMuIL_001843 [Solemya velum]
MSDPEYMKRLMLLDNELRQPNSVLNVDGLLDGVVALVADLDYPAIRRNKSAEQFLQRFAESSDFIKKTRMSGDDFDVVKVIVKVLLGKFSWCGISHLEKFMQ